MTGVDAVECEKLSAVQDDAAVLTRFVDWLDSNGMELARWEEDRLVPLSGGYQRLFARFFDIDLDKVEAERRVMLNELRS